MKETKLGGRLSGVQPRPQQERRGSRSNSTFSWQVSEHPTISAQVFINLLSLLTSPQNQINLSGYLLLLFTVQ
jgi:hypothetical protein